jgi:hypothetical protein
MPYCSQDIHTCMVSLQCGIVDVFWDSPALSKPCSTLQTETQIVKFHDFLYMHIFMLNVKLNLFTLWPANARSEIKPPLKEWQYDNVLPAQSYSTLRDSEEHGAIVEWWLAGENQRTKEKTLLQCHFIHYESHMNLPLNKPKALQWEARI